MENLTQKLFKLIINAPEHLKKKYFCNVSRIIDEKENSNWYNEKLNENNAIFSGLKFQENKVFVINIGIINENFNIKYLEISTLFNNLLKQYDIITLTIVINEILKKYYKEYTLTENILEHIQVHNEKNLPKFNHKIKQNNDRHKKFIDCNKCNASRKWNKILHKTLQQINTNIPKQNIARKRPLIFCNTIYSEITKLCRDTNCYKSS